MSRYKIFAIGAVFKEQYYTMIERTHRNKP